MACSTPTRAVVGESKAAISLVMKPTQSWVTSSNYVPSQGYTKLQGEDSLTFCISLSLTIPRIRLWSLDDFWRIYATWRTTRSCWAFLVLTSTNFLGGVAIGAKCVGLPSTAMVGTGFLSSLISGAPTWVPIKVEVNDLDRLALLSLVSAWGVCVGVEERSAWRSSWWSLLVGLCERKDVLSFLKRGFIVSSVRALSWARVWCKGTRQHVFRVDW